MFANRQGTSWQRKAVCEEDEFGLIHRKLRKPRTFFVFVNSFWLLSSAPPNPPRDMLSTKFSLCKTKSCTGGYDDDEDAVLLPGSLLVLTSGFGRSTSILGNEDSLCSFAIGLYSGREEEDILCNGL